MEIIDPEQKREFEAKRNLSGSVSNDSSGRLIAGLLVIAIGLILLARKMGFYFPDWLVSWPMVLIAIGIIIGAKNAFRPGGWIAAVTIGGIFLIDRFLPDLNLRPYIWPVILIIIGAIIIISPNRHRRGLHSRMKSRVGDSGTISSDELLDTTSVFGGVKKNVISKNFKGGEVTCIFGGAEINLSQADIQGKAFLEVNQLFGGTKLIIPANWQVQSESTAILGSVEDTRVGYRDLVDPDKILVLEGTSIFGGISIKSF